MIVATALSFLGKNERSVEDCLRFEERLSRNVFTLHHEIFIFDIEALVLRLDQSDFDVYCSTLCLLYPPFMLTGNASMALLPSFFATAILPC